MTRITDLARIALIARLDGVSLDLSRPLSLHLTRLANGRRPVPSVRVPTVWLGRLRPGRGQPSHLGASDIEFIDSLGVESIAVDASISDTEFMDANALIRQAETTRQVFGPERRLLIAIRPSHLHGGRKHLAELTALRHLAEEWDLGVALDLAGAFDPTWEAEAAVLRLGPRLRLLRIPTTAADRHPVGQARVASRAISAALEQGAPPSFAIVPTVPLWQVGSLRAKAERTLQATAAISQRVGKINEQRALFLGQDLWPNLRG